MSGAVSWFLGPMCLVGGKKKLNHLGIGRAIAQSVSHQLLTAEAVVRTQGSPCGICRAHGGTEWGFFPSFSVVPLQHHSTVALRSLMYHLGDGQRQALITHWAL
jgi:hypothetical protein